MKQPKTMIAVAYGCAALAACADPNELSEETIAAALQEEVSFLPCREFLIYVFLDDFQNSYRPGEDVAFSVPVDMGYQVYGLDDDLDDLVDLGIFQREDSEITYTTEPSTGRSRPSQTAFYTLTELGKSLVAVQERPNSDGSPGHVPLICIGKGEVAEILDFTIPGEGAAQSTMVTYRWDAANVSGEARRVNANDEFPDGPVPLSGTEEAVLVLTNNGWSVRE